MAQHDYDIANQAGAAFRADLNNALAAIVSQNSGATAPTTTFAGMFWLDTGTSIDSNGPWLRQRNTANTAWGGVLQVDVGLIDALQAQAYTAFTSAGAAPTYTLSPAPALTAYAAGQRFRVKFHAATTGAATLAVSGLAATAIKQYDSTGNKVDPVIAANQLVDCEYDGTNWVLLDPLPAASKQIQPITASVAANALTLTLNPTTLDFRSPTLGSGTINTRTVAAAISLVISSGSTLGSSNGVQSDIVLLAIDNAGTVELAAVNLAGGVNLDETTLISTTAEGGAGAADSATVIYSTTARTNVPFRVVGIVSSTQATAGTWATAPSLIQGAGGNALQHKNAICNSVIQATTSGTAFDFTNIPSWVNRITMMFNGVSTNGTSNIIIQLGAGSIDATNYLGCSTVPGVNTVNWTTGILAASSTGAPELWHGKVIIDRVDGNTWSAIVYLARSTGTYVSNGAGTKSLTGKLDRVRLTTANGTDAFDAGSVNISWE